MFPGLSRNMETFSVNILWVASVLEYTWVSLRQEEKKHQKGIFISWFLIRIEPMSAITGQETEEVINLNQNIWSVRQKHILSFQPSKL